MQDVDIRNIYSGNIEAVAQAIRQMDILAAESRFTQAVSATLHAAKQGLIFACGNGGSFSDADHTIGELVGWYADKTHTRPGVRALLLGGSPASLTAIANDTGYENIFARQLEPYGPFLQQHKIPGVLLAFTTSGNSPNILAAARVAKQYGISVVGFLGRTGGKMMDLKLVDHPLLVPSDITARIQEVHHALYHSLCAVVEQSLLEQ